MLKRKVVRPRPRSIVVFSGDVTPNKVTSLIPKDFCGDVVVNGSIIDPDSTDGKLIINTNDGNVFVFGDIIGCMDINIMGDLFCSGIILITGSLKVQGCLYGCDIAVDYVSVSQDVYAKETIDFVYELNVGGSLECETLEEIYDIKILGDVHLTKGLNTEVVDFE